MGFPLAAAADVLAKSAVENAPRLASSLMAANNKGAAVMVEPRPSTAERNSGASTFLQSNVAKWALAAAVATSPAAAMIMHTIKGGAEKDAPGISALASAAPLAKAAMAATPAGLGVIALSALANTPEGKHLFSKVGEIYKKFAGETGQQERRLTKDELIANAKPTAPGESNAMATKVSDVSASTPETAQQDMIKGSAAIIGVGFNNSVDLGRSNGAFESGVFKQLGSAINTIAPGKMLSQLSTAEKFAVVTATIYASNGSFLKTMAGQDPAVATSMKNPGMKKTVDAANSAPSAANFLGEFMKDGKFSSEGFLKKMMESKITGALASKGGLLAATPIGLKAMLITAAATKAIEVLGALSEDMKPGMSNLSMNPSANFFKKIAARVTNAVKPKDQGEHQGGPADREQGGMRPNAHAKMI